MNRVVLFQTGHIAFDFCGIFGPLRFMASELGSSGSERGHYDSASMGYLSITQVAYSYKVTTREASSATHHPALNTPFVFAFGFPTLLEAYLPFLPAGIFSSSLLDSSLLSSSDSLTIFLDFLAG